MDVIAASGVVFALLMLCVYKGIYCIYIHCIGAGLQTEGVGGNLF